MTNQTHHTIFTGPTVTGYQGSQLFPLMGSGQHRSARALENKGFGKVVSSSLHPYHAADYFFRFEDGYFFNWTTEEIDQK